MAISQKINAILQLKGKKKTELAKYLGMNSQSLSNKFSRNSFSAGDLIKIANFLDCSLTLEIDSKQKIIFEMSDIKDDK
jgi:transcriptional regulator with XRE-family HTH domain